MIFLQIVIILLLLLLLVRSINHDNRMARLEKFVGKIVSSVNQKYVPESDQIFSGETIENIEESEIKEVDDGERSEGSEAKEREDF